MPVHSQVRHDVDFADFFKSMREGAARFAYVLTYSSMAADEIAQDAFFEIYRRWGDIEHPKAYLWRCVLNRSRTWSTRERRTVPEDRRDTFEPDVEAMVVRTALARLPEGERELLVLRYFVGLSDRDIADALGRPLGSVKTVIRRGLSRMKEALDD